MMRKEIRNSILCFEKVKVNKPLIHMIPNQVTTSFCADMIAVTGARPIMALAPEDVGEITKKANGLVINLGQLNKEKIEAATISLEVARETGIPIVVDPVGIGASSYRLEHGINLIEKKWQGIIKCNASEYYAICHKALTCTGVDAGNIQVIKELNNTQYPLGTEKYMCITGKQDMLIGEQKNYIINHTDTRLPEIVGSGCVLGALMGVYYSQSEDGLEAMLLASLVMSIASIKAEEKAVAYRDYKHYLMDAVYQLTIDELIHYGDKLIEWR